MPNPTLSNTALGTHAGNLTRRAEVAIDARHLLLAPGTNPATQVTLAAADSIPLGVSTDVAAQGDPTNVALLGAASSTLIMTAAGSITAGTLVYAAADGQVQALPVAPGTYHQVGLALQTTTTQGQLIEVVPAPPTPITVS